MVEGRDVDILVTGLAREAVINDKDVNWSELYLDVIDQPFGSAHICHVGAKYPLSRHRDDPDRKRLGQLGVAAVGEGDPCDLAGQPSADRAADAATRSRDECDAPGQAEPVRHRSEFTRRSRSKPRVTSPAQ